MKVAVKICGMKHNTVDVAALQPSYLGFIFYDKSPRNFEATMPAIPSTIKKVGVFVDASVDDVIEKINDYRLDIVQLHGKESISFIKTLKRRTSVEVWKVWSVASQFNFNQLQPYEGLVNAFLFDTQGKHPGGNGIQFSWELLTDYPLKTPIILSGGIGLQDSEKIKEFISNSKLPILAVDINSQFEDAPGLKNSNKIKRFMYELSC